MGSIPVAPLIGNRRRSRTDAGAVIDAKDVNGDTPLLWGSWALREAPVLHLLCFGAYRVNPDRQTMAPT